MGMYILLYLKWITKKDLLFVTAQETQLSVIWQPGWEGNLGEDTCIYMAESLCCPPETITALLIGYTSKQNEVLKQECMIHEGRDLAITSPAHNALFYI